jgi:hypothetical protein
LVRAGIIEEFSWDWGGTACEDFSLGANLWGDREWRGDAGLSLQFWGRCAVGRDSVPILWGDRDSRDDVGLSLQFWGRCAAGRDSVPISWGDREWRDDANLSLQFLRLRAVGRDSDSTLWGGRELWDGRSLSDREGAAQFDFPDCSDGDFDPTLDVDRLAGDLKSIPDSDIPRDPGLLVGDSVLGHAFGGRDDSRRRGDIYLPDAAFRNIYLREVAVWRE